MGNQDWAKFHIVVDNLESESRTIIFSSGYLIVVMGMDASVSPIGVDNSSRSMDFERSSRFCSLNISRQPDIHVPSPFI